MDTTKNNAAICIFYDGNEIGGGHASYTANSSGHIDPTWLNDFVQGQVNIYNESVVAANNIMVVNT